MKQTQLKLFGAIILLIGLGIYAYIAPRPSHTLVPTKPITHDTATGGTTESTREVSAAAQAASTEKSAPTNRTDSKTPPPLETPQAPQQALTVTTTPKEHYYQALVTPNDPLYTGTTYAPWALQHTNAPGAWNVSTGEPVVVAVIDTGFALQHEDLVDVWYKNPGENGMTTLSQDARGATCTQGVDKSVNGCDDDNNGYTDDWRGWNFNGTYKPTADPCSPTGLGTYVANNNPQAGTSGVDIEYAEAKTCFGIDSGDPFEAVSHGTSTAGLTGAATNNGKGIATYNWNTKIMPLQALDDAGGGWTSRLVAAIRYAVDNGASVINLSFGGSDIDPSMQSAIQYAYAHNVVVVAAAGNCGTGTEQGCDPAAPGAMAYPALYPHVIAVGATTSTDTRANFSSYGRGLDVVAPGSGAIVSPLVSRGATPNNPATFNYQTAYATSLYGTSFASPIVASLASLIRSERPGSSVDDIVALIDASATKVPAMNGAIFDSQYGHGLINASAAATIAASLQSAGSEPAPTYRQTGSSAAEHLFTNDTTLSSGCEVRAGSYCTVQFRDELTGFERYMPYKNTTTEWQTPGSMLGRGSWWGRAMSGTSTSSAYLLLSK